MILRNHGLLSWGRNVAEAYLRLWTLQRACDVQVAAAQVNARGPLLARLRDCEHLRHHVPNLVAVNYYRRGDVMAAIDTINGVSG